MKALYFILCVVIGVTIGILWTSNSKQAESDNMASVDAMTSNGQKTDVLNDDKERENQNEVPALTSYEPLVREADTANTGISDRSKPATEPTTIYPVKSYHEGIMRVAPAVASVYANKTSQAGIVDQASITQGSGVIVDADGIVLTNLHLLTGLDEITVVLSDGRLFPGTLIGSDPETDLAVVRIPATGLPFLELNEAPPAKVGDVVLAIGNPFGVGQTVTQGIVSATRRRVANGSLWQSFIQIDAAINPGNSGGALINPYGQLVGVNTAIILADSGAVGIGFSIPAELLAQVVPQIIDNGSVARGWLGIDAEDLRLFPAIHSKVRKGAVVTEVAIDGPAYSAGVKSGDVVLRLGEQEIESATQFLLAVSALPPDATVKLVLLRDPDKQLFRESGKSTKLVQHEYKVKLGRRPAVVSAMPR